MEKFILCKIAYQNCFSDYVEATIHNIFSMELAMLPKVLEKSETIQNSGSMYNGKNQPFCDIIIKVS